MGPSVPHTHSGSQCPPLLTAQRPLSGEGTRANTAHGTSVCARLGGGAHLFHPHSTGQDSVTRPHLIITRGSTLAVCPGGRGKQQFLTHWIPLLPFRNESEHSLGHQEGSIQEVALAVAWKDGRLLPKMGVCVCRGTEVTLIPRLFPAPTSRPQLQLSRHKGTGLILPADSGWSSVIWEE